MPSGLSRQGSGAIPVEPLMRPLRARLLILLPLALAACLSDTTFVQPPPPGSSGDTTGGTVQRAALLVTVTLSGADSALAARLGAPAGVLPQAAVTVEREGSAASRRSDTTDVTGRVEFTGLLPGRYQMAVLRLLTAGEVTQFDGVDRDVNAFGGGRTLDVPGPHDTAVVEALAGRRGSLVISEVYDAEPYVNGVGYVFGGYVELYNNSDTTVYLDGKIFGVGPLYMRDFSSAVYNAVSCEDGAPYQLDPDGLWSRYFWRIPGSGRQYPLVPGRAAVLATDAIDHSRIDSRLPDLSSADFEFLGSSDADNPFVPNLISVGPEEFAQPLGHGLIPGVQGRAVYYVADTLMIAALPTTTMPAVPNPVPRIPGAKILDVFTSLEVPELEANALPACPQLISAEFDRQPGYLLEAGAGRTNTILRRGFAQLLDGRWILQRTKATALDFRLAPRPTPGWVP
jgi:hypothetical protein